MAAVTSTPGLGPDTGPWRRQSGLAGMWGRWWGGGTLGVVHTHVHTHAHSPFLWRVFFPSLLSTLLSSGLSFCKDTDAREVRKTSVGDP